MTKKIIIEKDEIDLVEAEANEFLKKIFFLENALVTDLTTLSDFTFSGFTKEQSEFSQNLTWEEKTPYWDKIILQRIKDVYDIELKHVSINLLLVLNMIKESQNRTFH